MDADKGILKQIRAGNKAAFGRLVVKYQDKVLLLIYDHLADYESAKDLAQEVFMKVYKSINSFKGESKFSTWLYRIAVNTTIDYIRKKHVEISSSMIPETQDERAGIERLVESGDLKSRVEKHLSRLSSQQQTAIILRYFYDETIKDIAEIMNCKENTVRIHLLRALEKLKLYFKE
jgi:RNA polymerase sigma-70 factor (ECF subfamily)